MSRFFVLLLVLLLAACEDEAIPITQENFVGYWLSGPIELDPNIYKPTAQFLHMNADSTMQYLAFDSSDTILRYEVMKDSVAMPFFTLPKSSFSIKGNRMKMRRYNPIHYLKLNAIELEQDSAEIRANLLGKHWKSKVDIITFHNDSIVVYDLETKKKEVLCWDIYKYKGIKFLQRKGNFVDCKMVPRFLEYIAMLTDDHFEVVRWDKDDFYKLKYEEYRGRLPSYKEDDFKLCNPYIYRNLPSDRYYFKYTGYEGGTYTLKKIFDKSYKPVLNGNNNGIVRIGFVVNCEGDIGMFDILEVNYDYKPIKIHDGITSQLLKILKDSKKWKPGEQRDEKIDTYKYLSFKIKDGKITEIFP